MHLLVGLGNPGAAYAEQRHNVGFMAIDRIVQQFALRDLGKKFNGRLLGGTIARENILALKPATFMNKSGESVQPAVSFYKIPLTQLFVLHDDLDLPLGKVRIKLGGGHGGHNGLRDLDRALGPNYWRIRIGIGRPEHKGEVLSYVLGDFSAAESAIVANVCAAIAEHLLLAIGGNPNAMASKIAATLSEQLPKKPPSDMTAATKD